MSRGFPSLFIVNVKIYPLPCHKDTDLNYCFIFLDFFNISSSISTPFLVPISEVTDIVFGKDSPLAKEAKFRKVITNMNNESNCHFRVTNMVLI